MKKIGLIALVISLATSGMATIQTIDAGATALSFTPANPTIELGDTVRFIWVSGNHTTTSMATTGPDVWDSTLNLSNQVADVIITTVGTHDYYCATPTHADTASWQGMVGTITVVPVGIRSLTTDNRAIAYPNPFNTSTTIDLYNIHADRLEIVNVMGQTIKSVAITSARSYTLYMADAPSGFYFYRIKQDGNIVETKRLIKN